MVSRAAEPAALPAVGLPEVRRARLSRRVEGLKHRLPAAAQLLSRQARRR